MTAKPRPREAAPARPGHWPRSCRAGEYQAHMRSPQVFHERILAAGPSPPRALPQPFRSPAVFVRRPLLASTAVSSPAPLGVRHSFVCPGQRDRRPFHAAPQLAPCQPSYYSTPCQPSLSPGPPSPRSCTSGPACAPGRQAHPGPPPLRRGPLPPWLAGAGRSAASDRRRHLLPAATSRPTSDIRDSSPGPTASSRTFTTALGHLKLRLARQAFARDAARFGRPSPPAFWTRDRGATRAPAAALTPLTSWEYDRMHRTMGSAPFGPLCGRRWPMAPKRTRPPVGRAVGTLGPSGRGLRATFPGILGGSLTGAASDGVAQGPARPRWSPAEDRAKAHDPLSHSAASADTVRSPSAGILEPTAERMVDLWSHDECSDIDLAVSLCQLQTEFRLLCVSGLATPRLAGNGPGDPRLTSLAYATPSPGRGRSRVPSAPRARPLGDRRRCGMRPGWRSPRCRRSIAFPGQARRGAPRGAST